MFNAFVRFRNRAILATAVALILGTVQAQQFAPNSHGPLARLVKTPQDDAGQPPYALADQAGIIRRYVEPVPGIDLEPYINQVVTVKHDTGETLLASQLDLPSTSLFPMVGEGFERIVAGAKSQKSENGDRVHDGVQQAEFVDNDDSTVELIEEGQSPPPEGVLAPDGSMPVEAIYPDGTPVNAAPAMGPNPGYYDPMLGAYPGGNSFPAPYGGYPGEYGDFQSAGFLQPFGQTPGQPPRESPHIYGELEINFIRAHVTEEAFGKLSEKYEFSPRFILGFSNVGNFNGRARYWVYGRGTNGLDPQDSLHIDLDVFDLEATHRFGARASQIELAAGFRAASFEIHDDSNRASGSDLIGITAAADGWTPLFSCREGCLGWTYGGRLSILAGDWSGNPDGELIDDLARDDNVVVHELYAGIGIARRCRNMDLNARLAFEMQNWHSDVLSEEGVSIGFVGPGVEIGVQF